MTDKLVAFVEQIARLTTDTEMDGDMSGDDAVDTLCGLIEEARDLVAMMRLEAKK